MVGGTNCGLISDTGKFIGSRLFYAKCFNIQVKCSGPLWFSSIKKNYKKKGFDVRMIHVRPVVCYFV